MRIRCMHCGEIFIVDDTNLTTEEARSIAARQAVAYHIMSSHTVMEFSPIDNEYQVIYTDIADKIERCLICEELHRKEKMSSMVINMPEFTGQAQYGFICDNCKSRIFGNTMTAQLRKTFIGKETE